MRVIDLLNKIAKGEENDLQTEFVFDKQVYNFYRFKNESGYCLDGWLLNQEILITKSINDNEDNKIEKMNYAVDEDGNLLIEGFVFDGEQKMQIIEKINEIINKVNSIEQK